MMTLVVISEKIPASYSFVILSVYWINCVTKYELIFIYLLVSQIYKL